LEVWRFDTAEDIQAKLLSVTQTDFHDGFQLWQQCWDWGVCSQGDYLEGDGTLRTLSLPTLFSDTFREFLGNTS
jgi:hypothetical protein